MHCVRWYYLRNFIVNMTIESGSWSIASTSIRWRAQVEEKVANRSCHDRFIFSLSSTYCSTLEWKRRSFLCYVFPQGFFIHGMCFLKETDCHLFVCSKECGVIAAIWSQNEISFFSSFNRCLKRAVTRNNNIACCCFKEMYNYYSSVTKSSKGCSTTTPVWPDVQTDVLLQYDQKFKQMYYSRVTRFSKRSTTTTLDWPDFLGDGLLSVTRFSKRCSTSTQVWPDVPQFTQK